MTYERPQSANITGDRRKMKNPNVNTSAKKERQ